MIRSKAEYKEMLRRAAGEKASLVMEQERLRKIGLNPSEMDRVMAPLRGLHHRTLEDIRCYEKVLGREIDGFPLRRIGDVLIGARLAMQYTQRALAKLLGTDESQVSRDERNEYSGITVERACDILDSLGVEVNIECSFSPIDELRLPSINPKSRSSAHRAQLKVEPLPPSGPHHPTNDGRLAA